MTIAWRRIQAHRLRPRLPTTVLQGGACGSTRSRWRRRRHPEPTPAAQRPPSRPKTKPKTRRTRSRERAETSHAGARRARLRGRRDRRVPPTRRSPRPSRGRASSSRARARGRRRADPRGASAARSSRRRRASAPRAAEHRDAGRGAGGRADEGEGDRADIERRGIRRLRARCGRRSTFSEAVRRASCARTGSDERWRAALGELRRIVGGLEVRDQRAPPSGGRRGDLVVFAREQVSRARGVRGQGAAPGRSARRRARRARAPVSAASESAGRPPTGHSRHRAVTKAYLRAGRARGGEHGRGRAFVILLPSGADARVARRLVAGYLLQRRRKEALAAAKEALALATGRRRARAGWRRVPGARRAERALRRRGVRGRQGARGEGAEALPAWLALRSR